MTMRPKAKTQIIMVSESCGCVICDLEIARRKVAGVWVHKKERGYATCTRVSDGERGSNSVISKNETTDHDAQTSTEGK